jgi:WD40 repeat protein
VEWTGADQQGTPLDERDLKVVENGLNGMRAPKPEEVRLLEASKAERLNRQKTSRRTNAKWLYILAAFIVVFFGVLVFYLQIRRDNTTRSNDLREHAEKSINNPNLSILMLLESLRADDANRATIDTLNDTLKSFDLRFDHFLSGHTVTVAGLAFSQDGNYLASAGYDGQLVLWYLKKPYKKQILSKNAHGKHSDAVAFSQNGRWLASGGTDGSIEIWDLTNLKKSYWYKKLETSASGSEKFVTSLSFSLNSNLLASGHANGGIQLLRISDRETLLELPREASYGSKVFNIQVCSDEKQVFSNHEKNYSLLWNPEEMGKIRRFDFPQIAKESGFEYFSTSLFSANCEIPLPGFTIQKNGEEVSKNVQKSSKGELVGYLVNKGSNYLDVLKKPGLNKINEWYYELKEENRKIYLQPDGIFGGIAPFLSGKLSIKYNSAIHSLAIDTDGKRFALGYANGLISIWNIEREKRNFEDPKLIVNQACKYIRSTLQIPDPEKKLFKKGYMGLFGQDNDPYRTNCPGNTR